MQSSESINQSKQSTSHSIFLADFQLAERYGVCRQTIWRWSSDNPTFPKPKKLSYGCSRWCLKDIEQWEVTK